MLKYFEMAVSKQKLDPERSKEQTKFEEYLVPRISESSIFLVHLIKTKIKINKTILARRFISV
jgi:hypothetical protein